MIWGLIFGLGLLYYIFTFSNFFDPVSWLQALKGPPWKSGFEEVSVIFEKPATFYFLGQLTHWKLLRSDQQASTLVQKGYNVI